MRYVGALDGLRALAVSAVIGYHCGVPGFGGGFLGVDLFFVLSGYLITSLLLAEYGTDYRIRLGRFYLRRARRLLPALFAMLLGTAVVVVCWAPARADRLRGDLLAAVGYVTNWWLIARGQSYFDSPNLLTHLWSLAVEEQFYLLWPVLLPALVVLVGRHRGRFVAALAGVALGSTALMAVLYSPWHDPSRVYYGTDTRAAPLLVGAGLAALWPIWRTPTGPRRLLDLAAEIESPLRAGLGVQREGPPAWRLRTFPLRGQRRPQRALAHPRCSAPAGQSWRRMTAASAGGRRHSA